MKGFCLFLALLMASSLTFAQDERYFRRIYSNELNEKPSTAEKFKIIVKSPAYRIDLNRDGFEEIIRTAKRDGNDYFTIADHFGRVLLEKKLSTIGSGSVVYRVQLKTISPNTDALVVHFYEGMIESTRFEAQARLYFITIPNRELNKMHFFQGPHFFHESEKLFDKYFVRRFSVNTVDYNNDGTKELSVSYNNINRVFLYVAEGVWKRL